MKKSAKYETSDGVKFYYEHDAKNHARSLKDRNVTSLNEVAEKVAEKLILEKKAAKIKETVKDAKEDFRQVLKKVELAQSEEELVEFEADERKSIIDAVAKRRMEIAAEETELEESETTK